MVDSLLKLVEALGATLALKVAAVLGVSYWLAKDFFPWAAQRIDSFVEFIRPFAVRWCEAKVKQLEGQIHPPEPSAPAAAPSAAQSATLVQAREATAEA